MSNSGCKTIPQAIAYHRLVPVRSRHDVVVVGGGAAGVCAALAAARTGARTLLIEQKGLLGGAMTAGLVTPVGATTTRSGERFGGILWEILDQVAVETKACFGPSLEPCCAPHVMAHVLSRLLVAGGVEVVLHTTLVDTVREGDKILRVLVGNKSGLEWVEGAVFVDASGDADLVAGAGEEFVLGSEPGVFAHLHATGLDQVHEEQAGEGRYAGYERNGQMQPVTLFFTMGGVDVARAESFNNRRLTYADLGLTREAFLRLPYANTPGFEVVPGEEVPLPQGRVLVTRTAREGVVAVNMSRITGVDGSDATQLARAELLARAQVFHLVDFLRRFVPGFGQAYLVETASALGVRETRRLVGRHVLTGTEAIRCTSFADVVAHGSYMIDIHDPQGRRKAIGGELQGDCFDIPWRSLVPRTVTNLLACGRCISVDHVAHSSTRIQGTCMMTGQAAGTGAALMVAGRLAAGSLDPAQLQARLRADGVHLIHILGNNSPGIS